LCQTTQPPAGTKNLLGLGLKYCVVPPKASPDIKKCMLKLAYRIRTKHHLITSNKPQNQSYNPQIYVKLKGWNPPPAPLTTEECMTNFEKKLKEAIKINNHRRDTFTSLTPNQKTTLNTLKHSKEFIIIPTDKNLGPAIINRDAYITQVLQEHLLNPTYLQLSPEIATCRIGQTKQLLIDAFNTYKDMLTQPEIDFFMRSFKNHHRTPIFYGMPKVHKTPMQLRPVVSCINSFPSIFSTWLDFRMKDLLHLMPSYLKNSTELIKGLQDISLPPGARLFTADASSMYTNIDTDTGLQALRNLFTTYRDIIPMTFPKDFFLLTLEIIMNNNVFSFGNTFWLQLQGTAMGTPAAPLYSILTYGYHENTQILNTFKTNLIYYKRYIDDIFGIWVDSPDNTWESFKLALDQFGSLHWNLENLTTSTNFLDLQIDIIEGCIQTKTYQKELNLYLYIPPQSAHPTSCLKGLITGELIRYWSQNTQEEDFINITQLFIQRLMQRGHRIEDLIPTLQAAASTIDSIKGNRNPIQPQSQSDDTLYIHWQFHPKDIKKNSIREIYDKTLKGHDNFSQMRIAMSRPKNLRDILCHTKIPDLPGRNTSDILERLQPVNIMLPRIG
jgi:hypothetical protein